MCASGRIPGEQTIAPVDQRAHERTCSMDRRILCATMLAATMCIGGSVFPQQSPGTSGTSTSDLSGASSSSGTSAGQSSSASDRSSGLSSSSSGLQSQAMTNDPDKLFIKMVSMENQCELQL